MARHERNLAATEIQIQTILACSGCAHRGCASAERHVLKDLAASVTRGSSWGAHLGLPQAGLPSRQAEAGLSVDVSALSLFLSLLAQSQKAALP